MRVLLHNWVPLIEAIENAVANDEGRTKCSLQTAFTSEIKDCIVPGYERITQRQPLKHTERTHRSSDYSSPAEYDEEVRVFLCRS